MRYSIKQANIVRCVGFIFLLLFNSQFMLFSEREQTEKIKVLEDGTTIINTYNNVNKHIKEEIILRNGRHKTTFFDIDEQPKYCSLYTGNGAFGLIYYDQAMAPLFKFFDYGYDDKELYFLSKDFKKIGSVKLYTENHERNIQIQKNNTENNHTTLHRKYFLGELIIGIIIGIIITKISFRIKKL